MPPDLNPLPHKCPHPAEALLKILCSSPESRLAAGHLRKQTRFCDCDSRLSNRVVRAARRQSSVHPQSPSTLPNLASAPHARGPHTCSPKSGSYLECVKVSASSGNSPRCELRSTEFPGHPKAFSCVWSGSRSTQNTAHRIRHTDNPSEQPH